ncbi:MAG: GNAT family N-acetyltransferase [Elusimicrobiota bacterium]
MDDVTIRPARVEDAAGIARVSVDTWRTAYQGIMPDDLLAGLDYAKRAAAQREHLRKNDSAHACFVAEDHAGRIIGFAAAGPRRRGDEDTTHGSFGFAAAGESDERCTGELYAIYVLAARQKKGVGRRLMGEAVRWLRDHGHAAMLVWVLEKNPTRKFYEDLGGRLLGSMSAKFVPLEKISYGWEDMDRLAALLEGQVS